MLACGSAHQQPPGSIPCLHAHHFGLIQQHAVGNDLRIQADRTEFLRHIVGCIPILGRRGQVGHGGQRLQLFAGQFCTGHRQELRLDCGLLAEVGITQNGLRGGGLRQQMARDHSHECYKGVKFADEHEKGQRIVCSIRLMESVYRRFAAATG